MTDLSNLKKAIDFHLRRGDDRMSIDLKFLKNLVELCDNTASNSTSKSKTESPKVIGWRLPTFKDFIAGEPGENTVRFYQTLGVAIEYAYALPAIPKDNLTLRNEDSL